MEFFNALVVAICKDSKIGATVVTPSALDGRSVAAWCTNNSTSVVHGMEDVGGLEWNTRTLPSMLDSYTLTMVGVPVWEAGTYPADSIVRRGAGLYYTPITTSLPPTVFPWITISLGDSRFDNIIADPDSFDSVVFQACVGACPITNCDTLQFSHYAPDCFSEDNRTFFIYEEDGVDQVFRDAGEYAFTGSPVLPEIFNAKNDTVYYLYDFDIPTWQVATSYEVDDFVYYDGAYYICVAPNTASPSAAPSSWQEIELNYSDFEAFWLAVTDPDYSGNANISIKKIQPACEFSRVEVKLEPSANCEAGDISAVGGSEIADAYYTFLVSTTGPETVSIPGTYAVHTGEFTITDFDCGITYDVVTFRIPEFQYDAEGIYFEGAFVVYDDYIYVCNEAVNAGEYPDASSSWTVVCAKDVYSNANYNDFSSILDDYYPGTAGYEITEVDCACTERYDITNDYSTDCDSELVLFAPGVTVDGDIPENYACAIFAYDGSTLFWSDTYISGTPVGMPAVNCTYDVIICAVPYWQVNLDPWDDKAIVYHDGQFWRSNGATAGEPGVGEGWTAIALDDDAYTSIWNVCESEAQIPVNREEYEVEVSCEGEDYRLQVDGVYTYECGTDTLNANYTVSVLDEEYSCYCIVTLLYNAGSYVGHYYFTGSPTSSSTPMSPGLADGSYQVETYVIPCCDDDTVYNTGEIVCKDGLLYVCDQDDTTGCVSLDNWTEIDSGSMRDTISTIKGIDYPGAAGYGFTSFGIDCFYNTDVDYEMTVSPDGASLEIGVSFNADITTLQFAYAAWLFDTSESGFAPGTITVENLTDPLAKVPVVDCMFSEGPFSFTGVDNWTSYCVLSVAVPYYKPGHMHSPDDITYFNGEFWKVNPALGMGTMNPPSESGSPVEWIKIEPSETYPSCDDNYWANWYFYIGEDTDYPYDLDCFEFAYPPSEDASELDMSASSVNSADASFAIIRTNPALTGNILLTVDKLGDLWFNSIDANEELSKDMYKHVPVDITKSHPANVYRFFDKGKTPFDIVFDVYNEVTPTVMTSEYEDQFDFSYYFSGVKYLDSKYYDEKFKYFAPLYIKKVLPEYFVVFKVDDPLNMRIDLLKEYDYEQTDYVYEIMKRATLIKSFDMGPDTKVGKYLRSMINDPMFPTHPLDVNFTEDGMTMWNGISIEAGTWNSKGELLYDLYTDDDPLKYFEDYITIGYGRNGIIFPNIVNLEFLFDDETSDTFDFNRYIGFYVNAVELEKFDIDVSKYNASQSLYGNSPEFFDKIDESSDRPRIVSNDEGVKVPYLNEESSLDYRDFGLFRNKIFINYVKDKDNVLHGLASDSPYEIDAEAGSPVQYFLDTMRFADKSIDLSKFFGSDDVFLQDTGKSAAADGLATSYIQVTGKLNNYDVIRIYHDAGTQEDSDGLYDDIIVYSQDVSPSYLPNPGDYYAYTLGSAGSPPVSNSYYVNGNLLHGSVDPVLSAVESCLEVFPNKTFEVVKVKDCIFIKSYASSFANGEYAIKFMSPVANSYDNVTIGGYTGSDLIGRLVNFTGGTDIPRRLIIDAKHKQKILDNMDELLVRTVNGWSRILSVANYVDEIDTDAITTEDEKDSAYESYFGKIALALEKNEAPDVSDGGFLIKTRAHAEFGVLSFFNVRDFDGDFYSTKYNRFPYWEYQKHLTVPSNKDLLVPGVKYIVKTKDSSGKIVYNGTTIQTALVPAMSSNDYFAVFTAVAGVFSYSVPTDGNSPIVSYAYPYEYDLEDSTIPTEYCQDSSSPVRYGSIFFDQNQDMNSFDGFFSIKDSRTRTAALSSSFGNLDEYSDRFTGSLIRNEYDYYRENFTKDFALTSKIIPHVCKWGYYEGKDARDNEYRLNNHIFFGEHNFSPSHIRDIQDESKMTHEWPYLVANYDFIRDRKTIVDNYCYFTEDIDIDALIGTEGEFERYFTHVPIFNNGAEWIEAGSIQQRYSTIRYNDVTDVSETFFRGARLTFRDVLRDPDDNIIYDEISGKPKTGDNRRFDGYKFSVLLRPVREDLDDADQSPLRMRFIENKEYGYVLFLIELAIGYDENVNLYIDSPITLNGNPNDSPPAYGVDWLYTNPPNARVDGDYRVSFNGNVSDMTYSFLYGARNKKFGWKNDLFSTIRIPAVFTTPSFTIDREYSESRSAYSNYGANLIVDLTEYGGVSNESPYVVAADYFGDIVFNGYPLVVSQNSMETSTGSMFSYITSGGGFIPGLNSVSAYRQVAGGRAHYEKFMKKLSFASIMNYVNEMGPYKDKRNGFIEYETYETSSSDPVSSDFFAEMLKPTIINKEKAIVPTRESVVPDKFKQVREIGFEFRKGSLQNAYSIYRYGGGYEPIFRDVFTFLSKYTFDYNSQLSTIFLANNVFATEMDKFGVIDNFCHMKVANKKILELQDDSKFYPVYELLDEITIGRDDFIALHSSWDYGFHKRYDSKNRFSDVAGALRVREDYTYFSKVLNLPFTTNVLDYAKTSPEIEYDSKITYEPTLVDDIDDVNVDNYCIVYSRGDDKNEWKGYINLRNAMIHKFKVQGVSGKFEEFLLPSDESTLEEYVGYTNIDDYVTAYLTENVYELYDVFDAYFYIKEQDDDIERFDMEYHDDTILLNQDWSLTKDVKINKYSRHVLSFSFIKPLNSGATLSPAIKIRLI